MPNYLALLAALNFRLAALMFAVQIFHPLRGDGKTIGLLFLVAIFWQFAENLSHSLSKSS